jgi:polysaccharide pyruvyl transferase WcaK-like protein
LPLYSVIKNNKLVPNLYYKNENPDFYENFDSYQNAYLELINNIIKIGKEKQLDIETLPFSFQDEGMAKIFINDSSVKHNKYGINIEKNINSIKQNDWVFCTRLHSTIMAIKSGAKITALTYADKNVRLLNDLNINKNQYIRIEDLLNPIQNLNSIHFKVEKNIVNQISESVSDIIENKIIELFND